jgi:hypothetical protein
MIEDLEVRLPFEAGLLIGHVNHNRNLLTEFKKNQYHE